MSRQNTNKLNQLLTKWPSGTVAVYEWLKEEGIYRQLAERYVKSGWLQRVGNGAFVRLGEQVDWSGGLYALQNNMKLPVHVSGMTAMQLQGYAHYIPLGPGSTVFLMGAPGTRLPKWFLDYPWQINIKFKSSNLFGNSSVMGLVSQDRKNYEIRISVPERAMMELLSCVPDESSFEYALSIMEGLTTLRADFVQNLLESCRSVKVKRLFLFLADHCDHNWFKRINMSKLDLGKGKRMLVKNGQLDPKYLITVPTALFRE